MRTRMDVIPLISLLMLSRLSPSLAITTDHSQSSSSDDECGVYFAPSTIPGAGFGMFAGVDYKPDDVITPGDLIVPYTDVPFHNGVEEMTDITFMWKEYAWSARSFDYMRSEAYLSSAASFGLGAAVNCFFPLLNFEDDWDTVQCDSAGLHRSRDPGAGAFTSYHNRVGVASENIPRGMELFLDYGKSYFDKPAYTMMPFREDFKAGDKVLHSFVGIRNNLLVQQETQSDLSSALPNVILGLIHEFKNIWSSRVLNTLPEDTNAVDELVDVGVKYMDYNRSIHSMDFLREHGTCMDHLRPGRSTIEQAGRGAFAKRRISEGEIISPVPLIHIPDREMFDMYRPENQPFPISDEDTREKNSDPYHKQLLLNYCFGHRDISILLCPYGVVTSLINHSKEKANAKIVWSKKSMQHPEWLETPVSEWVNGTHSGLAFDLIAKRDLDVDEEVFLDYGDEWKDAWAEHEANWSPPPNSDDYQPDFELDRQQAFVIKTVREGSYSAKYHQLRCREVFRTMWGLAPFDGISYPCRAIDRYEKDGETLYNVEILLRHDSEKDPTICIEEFEEILLGVPHDIFHFEDLFYTRDQMQPWSFRHDMRIPDELVPAAWITEGSCAGNINHMSSN